MDRPVAIITGAGGGIGRATAQDLAARGYRLLLVGRTETTVEQTRAALGAAPADVLAVVADVTRIEDVERVVARALADLGRIDAVVNNAGYAPVLSVEHTTPRDWHAVLDTNLSAAFYFSRAVWPAFREQGSGVIVNVSSASARDPFPGFCAYGAAKAGLNLLSLALAREGAPIGVRVHAVAPSATETPMFRGLMTPEQYPPEKTLAPSDVARVIGQCVVGDLRHTSGEVIWVHQNF